jgi:hypothetical protein
MIANISRQLTTGAFAIAGSVAAFGFAGAAQALTTSTLTITGSATISPWGTTNPVLTPTNITSVTPSGAGQFAGVTLADVTTPGPFTLNGTGTGTSFTFSPPPGPSLGFTTITTVPGLVTANVTPTLATGSNTPISGPNSLTTYSVNGSAIFIEPFLPNFLGAFNIGFTLVGGPGDVAGTYTLTLVKTDIPVPVAVPEPSTILGILAVAGAGAFARRQR